MATSQPSAMSFLTTSGGTAIFMSGCSPLRKAPRVMPSLPAKHKGRLAVPAGRLGAPLRACSGGLQRDVEGHGNPLALAMERMDEVVEPTREQHHQAGGG